MAPKNYTWLDSECDFNEHISAIAVVRDVLRLRNNSNYKEELLCPNFDHVLSNWLEAAIKGIEDPFNVVYWMARNAEKTLVKEGYHE